MDAPIIRAPTKRPPNKRGVDKKPTVTNMTHEH
jgi:hypothetical protein